MTHELVHTAFPQLRPEHHWLEEGLATYVEPLARARIGLESDADVWRQLLEGLPKGQPRRGDRGLDRTPTWGRTYWGGALFCFLADVRIRERTSNRLGLRDALRSLVADGWTITRWAHIEDVLARMDAAVGVPVLSELYAQHAQGAVRADLAELWRRLGITYDRGRVTFDDSAPAAALRRAITR
jgi:predicted metalloprotease with PDZ domain